MGHALRVDRDIDAAESLRAMVATERHTVTVAHSWCEARRQVALQQPVPLDLQLPDGSGMDLCPVLELIANPEAVLATRDSVLETSTEALRRGAAADALPSSAADLADAVRR